MSTAPSTRRARYFLYVVGGVFVAVGFALDTVPSLAAVAPPLAARISAFIGALVLTAGRFGSDRFVSRCESIMTGWP